MDAPGSRPQRGFTLIEAMTVIAVLGIVAAIAAPSFRSFLAASRLRGAANEAYADLQYARMETVQRNRAMSVTFSADGYFVAASGAAASDAIKSVTLAQGTTVSSGSDMVTTFDPVRATATVTGGPVVMSATGTGGTARLTVNTLGRAELCSPSGTLKGMPAC